MPYLITGFVVSIQTTLYGRACPLSRVPREWVPADTGMTERGLRNLTERRLLDLRAGLLDELRPAGDVFLDEGAEFLGGVADRLEAEAGPAVSYLGVLHGGDEEHVQLLDDGARGAGGDEDAVPAEDVEAGEAGFGDGGKVGGEGGALDGGDGEAADAAGLDVRQACGADGEHELDLAGEKVGDRRGNGLVRDVHHVHAGHLLEELGGEVRRGAAAAGAGLPLAGVLLWEVYERGDGLHRHGRMDREHEGRRAEERHGREVAHHVVVRLVDGGIDRVRAGHEEERVTVGRRLGDRFGRDRAAAAALLLDDHRLAPGLGHLLAEEPRERIGTRAHDEMDRLRRGVGLRGRESEEEEAKAE